MGTGLVGDLALDERRPHVARAHGTGANAGLGAFEGERLHEPEHAVLRRHVPGLERRGDEPVHRGDDDDPAVAGRFERGPRVPRQQERARQDEREKRVPAILVELGDRRDVLESGVRNEGVEAAEALERCVDRGPVALAGREVRGERLARAARVGLEVDGQHVPAVGDETLGDRAADPARRAGDERGLGQGPPRT